MYYKQVFKIIMSMCRGGCFKVYMEKFKLG